MGRKTWESIPNNVKPLKNRLNIVVSTTLSKKSKGENFTASPSFQHAIKMCQDKEKIEKLFLIGGSGIYETALRHDLCDKLYLTEIDKEFSCDVFFPKWDKSKYKIESKSDFQQENGLNFTYVVYNKCK
ncbi:hypothetical protein MHBO_002851 [Bonamia ostreae]|uniref:dihydrofolate reductase n=1 Tax=Bonamia ostreae TaxID=126728 RepID=A0ABV2ANS1_9EUKA